MQLTRQCWKRFWSGNASAKYNFRLFSDRAGRVIGRIQTANDSARRSEEHHYIARKQTADDFGKLTRADLILINSTQSLANLSGLFSGRNTKKLYKQQLLVVSPRLVDEVEQAGFEKKPLVADNATDQAVLETILVWQRQREI